MGLDIQLIDSNGTSMASYRIASYGAYSAWRDSIAGSVGINLKEMDGYGGSKSWDGVPYATILNHSDCDGTYSAAEIDILRRELPTIPKSGIRDNMVEACESAFDEDCTIEFG